MARMPKTAEPETEEPEVTQAEPTRPWPRDENGRALDKHGLPINGPARIRALEEQGIEDPALAEQAGDGTVEATEPTTAADDHGQGTATEPKSKGE